MEPSPFLPHTADGDPDGNISYYRRRHLVIKKSFGERTSLKKMLLFNRFRK